MEIGARVSAPAVAFAGARVEFLVDPLDTGVSAERPSLGGRGVVDGVG